MYTLINISHIVLYIHERLYKYRIAKLMQEIPQLDYNQTKTKHSTEFNFRRLSCVYFTKILKIVSYECQSSRIPKKIAQNLYQHGCSCHGQLPMHLA